jgi:hypothetical protein
VNAATYRRSVSGEELAIVMSATGRDARSVQNAFRHRIFGPVADVLTFYRTTMIDRALDLIDRSRELPPEEQFFWTCFGWVFRPDY